VSAKDANRTREAGHLAEIQGVVAKTLNLPRQGAVGFIDWLDVARRSTMSLRCRSARGIQRDRSQRVSGEETYEESLETTKNARDGEVHSPPEAQNQEHHHYEGYGDGGNDCRNAANCEIDASCSDEADLHGRCVQLRLTRRSSAAAPGARLRNS